MITSTYHPGEKIENEFLKEKIRSKINEMLKWKRRGFPGCNPVSLTNHNIKNLFTKEYLICEKTDGVRYFLFIASNTTFLIDRNYEIFKNDMHIPTIEDLSKKQQLTLLDGELVEDIIYNEKTGVEEKKIVYLIYDGLYIQRKDITNLSYFERLTNVYNYVITPLKKYKKSQKNKKSKNNLQTNHENESLYIELDEKDNIKKRKSNLNNMLTEEENVLISHKKNDHPHINNKNMNGVNVNDVNVNGVNVNGVNVNGVNVNGVNVNGVNVNGVNVNGVNVNGVNVNDVNVNDVDVNCLNVNDFNMNNVNINSININQDFNNHNEKNNILMNHGILLEENNNGIQNIGTNDNINSLNNCNLLLYKREQHREQKEYEEEEDERSYSSDDTASTIHEEEIPFEIYLKDFYPIEKICELIKIMKKLPHYSDGIIFTPLHSPYITGNFYQLLKWKPLNLNTVDFGIETIYDEYNIPSKFELFISINGVRTSYKCYLAEYGDVYKELLQLAISNKISHYIIECYYVSKNIFSICKGENGREQKVEGGWIAQKIRFDKNIPNDISTLNKVIQSILDNITIDSLIKEISRNRKAK
ncbi:RNA guanylyltransferase [Plasmodium reichenowi]|uniref:mRNA guanylyltransferase n=1 Tax=Plasmodium reichenowi TaxID=5854 RepID=A0A151L4E0_PLARE|nr:RNA guanylyltransferase [Plasmodium reichenowi]KYN93808.1 RNA guanylyltransferase [Plasmodium reichenowi]